MDYVPGEADSQPLDAPSEMVATDGSDFREDLVAFSFEGTIRSISDGDTVSIKVANGALFSIRMSDMDTPEVSHEAWTPPDCKCKPLPYRPGQPGGENATDYLKSLVSVGDDVIAECYEVDRYGRMVCHVFNNDTNLNLEMIKSGWGWLPKRSDWIRDPESAPAELIAKDNNEGAWGLPDQVSPETWRKECWGEGKCEGSPDPTP